MNTQTEKFEGKLYVEKDMFNKQKLSIESSNQNEKHPLNKNSCFYIEDYSPACEENSKIEKVFVLAYSPLKISLFCVFNILSLFTLTFPLIFSPFLRFKIFYQNVSLTNPKAKFIAIYSKGYKTISISILFKKYALFPSENGMIEQLVYSFRYHFFEYFYLESTGNFIDISHYIRTNSKNNFDFLNEEQVCYHLSLCGYNSICIENKDIIISILEQIISEKILFSIALIAYIFILKNVTEYGIGLLLVTLITLVFKEMERRRMISFINKEVKKEEVNVVVYRKDQNGNLFSQKISSSELVLGDIYEIPNDGYYIPCETLLMNGCLIVKDLELQVVIISSKGSENILNRGMKVIQKRLQENGNKTIGKVIGVSFDTLKGKFLRKFIIHQKRDYCNLIIASFLMGIICLIYTYPYSYMSIYSPSLIALYGALSNLFFQNKQKFLIQSKQKIDEDSFSINCYHPVSINKEKKYFFSEPIKDLTEMTNNVFNYYKSKRISEDSKQKEKEIEEFYIECLSTCHYITSVNKQLISNDKKELLTFKDTKWILYEPEFSKEIRTNYDSLISKFVRPSMEKDLQEKVDNFYKKKEENVYSLNSTFDSIDLNDELSEELIFKYHYELGIVRHFVSESNNKTMTVIVKDNNEPYFKIFSKGQPKDIRNICKGDTLPENFESVIGEYHRKGKEVIGLSAKMMKMNYLQSQKIERELIEKNMIFLGLVVIEKNIGSNKEDKL